MMVAEGVGIPENALNPGDDLVTGRVGGLVQVDHAGADVGLDVAAQRRAAMGDGSEVGVADEHWKFESVSAKRLVHGAPSKTK